MDSCENSNNPMGPVKSGGILWLSEVSQEGLCSTELFSYPGYFLDKVQKFEEKKSQS